jgi:rhodanese-related sulfurtransferase
MTDITPRELHLLMQQQDIYLLDVREPLEHETFNIGGQLISLSDVMSNATSIPKNKPVVVYCKKGLRSQLAIQRLEDKFGFTNLINLKGGMEAWKRELK